MQPQQQASQNRQFRAANQQGNVRRFPQQNGSNQNMSPKPQQKKKHYWWRYLLFTVLGVTLGIGGVAVGGYVAADKVPVKTWLSLTGQDPDAFLREDYQNKSAVGLIMSLLSGGVDNLSSIDKITPLLGNVFDNLNDTLEEQLGFEFDKDQLFSKDFSAIADYIVENMKNNVTLEGIFHIDPESTDTSALLYFLTYTKNEDGTYNTDSPRTIVQLIDELQNGSLLDDAKLCELIDINDPESSIYALKDFTVKQLKDDFAGTIGTLKISEVMKIDVADPETPRFLISLVENEVTVNGLSDFINNELRFADVVTDEGTSKIISTLVAKNPKIKEISNVVQALKVGEIIDISETDDQLLQTIKDWEIGNLGSNLRSLKFGDVFSASQISSSKFLKSINPDTLISDLATAIENIKIVDAFGDEIWGDRPHDFSNMDKTWKYMLLDKLDPDGYLNYTIGNDIGKLVENMSNNINTASVFELVNDGLVIVDDSLLAPDGLLHKRSMASKTDEELQNPTGDMYGNLTMAEFSQRISWYIDLVSYYVPSL